MSEELQTQTPPASTDAAPAAAAPAPEQPKPAADSPPASKPSYAESRKAREDSILKDITQKLGTTKKDAPAEPAAAADAVTPGENKPAAQPKKDPPNPADAPAPQAVRQDALVTKDRDGKDLTITMDQAKRALLRDGMDPETLEGMSKKRQLEFGAKRFLAQREQDKFGSEAAQWRRAAESKAAPADAPPPTATGTDAAASAPANHGQAASTAPAPQSQAPAPTDAPATPAWKARMQALRDVAGDDVAQHFESILEGAVQETLTHAKTASEQQIQALQQSNQQVMNILVNDRFSSAFKSLEKDFPQVADESVKEEVRQYADSIARSGRYADPFSSIETIVREACHARLGNQQQETTTRKLLGRQQVQLAGQVDAGEARKAAPAAALSKKDLALQAFAHFQKTGSHAEANQRIRDLTAARG